MKTINILTGIFLITISLSNNLSAQKMYCSESYVSYSFDKESSQWIHSYTVDGISIQITTCFTFSDDNSTILLKNNKSTNVTLNVDKMTYEPDKKISIYICNSGPGTFYQITLDLFNNKILLLTTGGGKTIKQEYFIKRD